MNSRVVSTHRPSEISFPSESVRRVPRKRTVKILVIALLVVASFLIFVATMLVHYPQKVDAFLNSDEGLESKHVVTTNK
jgi:hypothetical protein